MLIGLFFDYMIYYNHSEKEHTNCFISDSCTGYVNGTICVLCIIVQRIIDAYEKN